MLTARQKQALFPLSSVHMARFSRLELKEWRCAREDTAINFAEMKERAACSATRKKAPPGATKMDQKNTQRYPESTRNLAAAEKPWMLIYLASTGARFAVRSRSVSHTKQVVLPQAVEEKRSSSNQHEPRGTDGDLAPMWLRQHRALSRRNARSPDASTTSAAAPAPPRTRFLRLALRG